MGCQTKEKPNDGYTLRHRVTDDAELLTREQEDSLIAIIEDLEKRIGSQIAVLTVPSLNGQKIEEFSLRTAESTGLGRVTHNDGV